MASGSYWAWCIVGRISDCFRSDLDNRIISVECNTGDNSSDYLQDTAFLKKRSTGVIINDWMLVELLHCGILGGLYTMIGKCYKRFLVLSLNFISVRAMMNLFSHT